VEQNVPAVSLQAEFFRGPAAWRLLRIISSTPSSALRSRPSPPIPVIRRVCYKWRRRGAICPQSGMTNRRKTRSREHLPLVRGDGSPGVVRSVARYLIRQSRKGHPVSRLGRLFLWPVIQASLWPRPDQAQSSPGSSAAGFFVRNARLGMLQSFCRKTMALKL
jgi:hypothetical protein